jgi:hypothetical protein
LKLIEDNDSAGQYDHGGQEKKDKKETNCTTHETKFCWKALAGVLHSAHSRRYETLGIDDI